MGTTSFSGPGAGRYPTANSVVNDIVRLGVGKVGTPFPFDKVCTELVESYIDYRTQHTIQALHRSVIAWTAFFARLPLHCNGGACGSASRMI